MAIVLSSILHKNSVGLCIATYYYNENDWSDKGPYEVSIIPQPAPALISIMEYTVTYQGACMLMTVILTFHHFHSAILHSTRSPREQ